jgi:poly(hydroxyalkanoate) depolymerase family esterase
MNEAADRHGFVVVYPEQQRSENPQGCWNWFLPEHQRRGAGEPAVLAGILQQLLAPDAGQAIDAGRLFVAGLSSGGAMAAILAATYPDLVAAVAVHSGLAYGSATTMPAAFTAMSSGAPEAAACGQAARRAMGSFARPVPSMVIHGSADHTVAPINARQVLEQTMTANRLASPDGWDVDAARPSSTSQDHPSDRYASTRQRWTGHRDIVLHELLIVEGLGHAWSGGVPGGSYTDPRGPDATEAIWSFFAQAAGA